MKKKKIKLDLKKTTIARLNAEEKKLIKGGGGFSRLCSPTGPTFTIISCGYIDTKPCDRES